MIEKKQNAKRLHYIDVAKGILILLLLIHHYNSANKQIGFETDYDCIITGFQPLFTTFFMQCFFIISGYCSNFNKEAHVFFIGSIKQLVIPYFVFESLLCIFSCFSVGEFSLFAFLKPISTVPYTTLWFLIALFFAKIVYFFFIKIHLSPNEILIITLIMLVTSVVLNDNEVGENILCYRNSLASCFFLSLGSVLKGYDYIRSKYIWICPFLYFGTFAMLFLFNHRAPVLTAFIGVSFSEIPVFLVLTINGSLFFLKLCSIIKENIVLEFFGRNSLVVYGIHFMPLCLILNFMHNVIQTETLPSFILFIMFVYCLEIATCFLFIYLFNTKYLKFLIGKF